MLNHKHLAIGAIIMVVVFLAITVAYPLLFKPGAASLAPTKNIPVNQPAAAGQ